MPSCLFTLYQRADWSMEQFIFNERNGLWCEEHGDYTKSFIVGVFVFLRVLGDGKDESEPLTVQEIDAALSSNLTGMCPPFFRPEIVRFQVFFRFLSDLTLFSSL